VALSVSFAVSALRGDDFRALGLGVPFPALADFGLAGRLKLDPSGVRGLETLALLADSGRAACGAAGERVAWPKTGLLAIGTRRGDGLPATAPVSLLLRVETLGLPVTRRGEDGVLALEAGALFCPEAGVLPTPGDPLFEGAGLLGLGDTGLLVLGEGLGKGVLSGAGLLGGGGGGAEPGEGVLLTCLLTRGERGLLDRGEGDLLIRGDGGLLGSGDEAFEDPEDPPGAFLTPLVGVPSTLPSCEPVEWRRWGPRRGARGVVVGDCRGGEEESGTGVSFPVPRAGGCCKNPSYANLESLILQR
jgi:hypothetical protein